MVITTLNAKKHNSDRLEKLQLEAARIVTGLTCYSSLDSIYRETGWEKLSTRREVKTLFVVRNVNSHFGIMIENESTVYL
jgi:hypothetical protein